MPFEGCGAQVAELSGLSQDLDEGLIGLARRGLGRFSWAR